MSKSLIMISAMYENGGNTTHRLLDGHPQLKVYPFESQVGTGYNNDFLSSYVPIRYRWPEFPTDSSAEDDYEAFWDEELKMFLRAPSRSKFRDCGLVMDESKRKARFVELCSRAPRTRASRVRAFFEATFDTWENAVSSGKERYFVGYNPVQVLDTEKILSDFPDGHIVHVVRNPFAGYADQFRRPFPPSLARYAHTWAYAQVLALTYEQKYPKNFHVLRFEDLVENRKETMGSLLEKLGLDWNDAVMKPSFNGSLLDQVQPWGTIRNPTREENWSTANELSQEQKNEVSSYTRVPLHLLGYAKFLATGSVVPRNLIE